MSEQEDLIGGIRPTWRPAVAPAPVTPQPVEPETVPVVLDAPAADCGPDCPVGCGMRPVRDTRPAAKARRRRRDQEED